MITAQFDTIINTAEHEYICQNRYAPLPACGAYTAFLEE